MRNHKKAAIVFFVFLFISSCSNSEESGIEHRVVIQVDDHVLTLTEFNEFFEPLRMSYPKEQGSADPGLREARLRFLLELVEEMIIIRRAEELDLRVSAQELEEAVSNIEGDYSGEGFKGIFMKQAISLETWKERLRRQLLVEKVIRKELLDQISLTPEEIAAYYDKHREEWTHGEQIRVRHILVSSEEEANSILERLKRGADFATLARLHSIAPESERGGDMGHVVRGHLPQCLEDPIFALEKDTVSPVIKTPYGYHIFKVTERGQAGEPKIDDWIDKIEACIRGEKLEVAYGPWLAKLRSRYEVRVDEEIIQ